MSTNCRIILGIIAFVTVVFVGIVQIVYIVKNSNILALQRYCIINPNAKGDLSIDSSEGDISWYIQYNAIGPITSIYIMGPIPIGLTTGPLQVALCGAPTTLSCDNSILGVIQGTINNYGGASLYPYISAIRYHPTLYYLQINTGTFPLGEVFVPLGVICGTQE